MESLSWALAERALRGVGDADLGEWREHGRSGVMHIRRRLTAGERLAAGGRIPLQVRDVRGTEEEGQRLRRLGRDVPWLAVENSRSGDTGQSEGKSGK